MEEEEEITAMLVDPCTKVETKLYDSGASWHMSPAKDKFISYCPIKLHAIRAADKHVFYAIEAGDLQIDVPNGTTTSNVLLKDALYTPEIGVIIVLVSHIAKAGKTVSFTGNYCKIKNPDGTIIGCILKNSNGLYKVQHNESNAAEVLKKVSLSTLHRQLGHISVDFICSLVYHHVIEGVELIPDTSPFCCNLCDFVKMTQKLLRLYLGRVLTKG
jgi:hypothetical protein